MKKDEYRFSFDIYNSIDELPEIDAVLLKEAKLVTKNAYAPYSNFFVGAAARLMNGEVVKGTNQENASYPVGICAERVLLSTASSLYPNQPIDTLAITYDNKNGKSDHPVSPCGMCRQALVEHEARTKHQIRLVLSGLEGKIYVIENAGMLLPFCFKPEDMD